ncbi:protein ZNF365 isoform X1 [Ahaetulla prasina]|uniref:protein ZNF365 isoform X1 n=1 Tax=Ahaetulla prasina TaxID=499056 RepID=UPI0026477BC8|nr:protein ZNF365 isoform X1 [Ahaetulla prasina]XP_058044860.1 protein ZNF365 isoform X1 [Ahaetulla prasina]
MQQKAFEDSKSTWQESLDHASARMPFRCPRCGDHARFRSLSSLRAHLEYSHAFEDRSLRPQTGLFSPFKEGRGSSSSHPQTQGNFRDGGNSVLKPRLSYLNFCEPEDPLPRRPLAGEAEWPADLGSGHASAELSWDPTWKAVDSSASFEAHVREKFNHMVEAVDKTIERRIDNLSRELSRKTAELLEVRAAFVQLSQKKQEVQRRERALNRQVDVAVEMIAVLQQRLTESEEELHRKEEEVVTFNHFLEEAAEKEVRGKARLERFIENLLQRVDQAEKQLEKYQHQHLLGSSGDLSQHLFTDLSSFKKARCLWGHPHSSGSPPDPKPHLLQKGRLFLKKVKDDRLGGGLHPVKWLYEPAEGCWDIGRPQKKAEAANNIARKVNAKSKISKKSKPVY